MTTIAEIVNERFQEEPTAERQQNMRRATLIADLQEHYADHRAHGSSNDVVQMLDDFLTSRGLPTVLYV